MQAKRNSIVNDTVWLDTQGREILAQGGGIIQVGDTFHWFGPQFIKGVRGFSAVNHYTSDDLVNWNRQAPAFTSSDKNIPFGPKGWVGRPWVMHNKKTGKYVMVIEWGTKKEPGVRNQFVFLTSDSIYGPWFCESIVKRLPDNSGELYSMGDLGAFQDDDGNAYLCYTCDKGGTNRTQMIAKLDPDSYTKVLPPDQGGIAAEFNGETREAAAMIKRGSTYYYFASMCNGWHSSQTVYRTAKNIFGPWTSEKILKTDPVTPDSYNTQHDFVLKINGSQATSYIYCGDRWSNFTDIGIGRYGWFPLVFDKQGVPTLQGLKSWSIDVKTGIISGR